MAHILSRKYGSGSVRYTAVIRLRKGATVLHREAKTFTHRAAAVTWAKHREVELENPKVLAAAGHSAPTLAALIRWYIDSFETISKWQRSKQAHLEFLERHNIGTENALKLTVAKLIDHVRSRRADGAGPATVANDLVWIGVVLRTARSVEAIPVDPSIAAEAAHACRALRLTAKSRKRGRRPSPEEVKRLLEFFAGRDKRSHIPMRDILNFALQSARRESEICRLEWHDNDEGAHTGLVRDAKHPRIKEGNHRRFKYTPEAWSIVEQQPRTSEYIFPYEARSVSAAFTRACHLLGIKDLRFHDMRHEATSRLFERGYQIHEVAQFTLHESWNELKRYANLRPENVRELLLPSATSPKPSSQEKIARAPIRTSRAAGRSGRQDQPRSQAREISVRRA